MRIQPRKAAPRAAPRPSIPFTFQCSCCELVEHRPSPSLPEGWGVEEIRGDLLAYCPTCVIDLPRRELMQ